MCPGNVTVVGYDVVVPRINVRYDPGLEVGLEQMELCEAKLGSDNGVRIDDFERNEGSKDTQR